MIANCIPIESQIVCRTVMFIKNTLSSKNTHVNLLMNIAMQGSQSSMSKSINYILARYRLTHYMFYAEASARIIRDVRQSACSNIEINSL